MAQQPNVSNRRRFYRIPGDYTIGILSPDGEERFTVQSKNLSASGVLIVCKEKLKVGETLSLSIRFPEEMFRKIKEICRCRYGLRIESPSSSIKVEATVMRSESADEGRLYGLQFHALDKKTLSFLIRYILEEAVSKA